MNEAARLTLRLPTHIKDWLKKHSVENMTSMNAEINKILKAAKETEAKQQSA